MLSQSELSIIRELAAKYKLKSVFLFGSSVDQDDARDIDLGIEGVESGTFFSLYGELFKHLSKPVDLIDLQHNTAFDKLIKDNGIKIYG